MSSYLLPGFLCVPIACALAYVPHIAKLMAIPKAEMKKYGVDPRNATKELLEKDNTELGKYIGRCTSAHYNQLETLPMFIGAIIMAKQAGVSASTIDTVGTLYVALRVFYNYVFMKKPSKWTVAARFGSFSVCGLACLYLSVKAAFATM